MFWAAGEHIIAALARILNRENRSPASTLPYDTYTLAEPVDASIANGRSPFPRHSQTQRLTGEHSPQLARNLLHSSRFMQLEHRSGSRIDRRSINARCMWSTVIECDLIHSLVQSRIFSERMVTDDSSTHSSSFSSWSRVATLPLLECVPDVGQGYRVACAAAMLLISNNLGVLPKQFFPKHSGVTTNSQPTCRILPSSGMILR